MELEFNDRGLLNQIINNAKFIRSPKVISLNLDLYHIDRLELEDADLTSIFNALYINNVSSDIRAWYNKPRCSVKETLLNEFIDNMLKVNPESPIVKEGFNPDITYNVIGAISTESLKAIVKLSEDMVKRSTSSTPTVESLQAELNNIKSLLGIILTRREPIEPLGNMAELDVVYDNNKHLGGVELGKLLYQVKYPTPQFFEATEEEALEVLKLYKVIKDLTGLN